MKVSDFTGALTGEAAFAKYTDDELPPSCDEVARLAYQLYEARGRQDGHDVEDWLAAERELVHHYREGTGKCHTKQRRGGS